METRRRGRPEAASVAIGGPKKSKQEKRVLFHWCRKQIEAVHKIFSTLGCQFGEGWHFSHYVAGGYNAVAQMMNLPPVAPPFRAMPGLPSPPVTNGSSSPAVKTQMCNKYSTAEGCKFGDKCDFARGH